MKSSIRMGGAVFAIGIAGLGALSIIHSDFVLGLEPVPSWVPFPIAWAYLTGIVLIAVGASIAANIKARLAAISLGLILSLWVLLLHLPKLVLNLRDGGEWTCAFETIALGGAAWVLAGILNTDETGRQNRGAADEKMVALGLLCFAVSLPVFGIQHFIYYDYVASVIPGWIPWHLFWAYFVGIAFFFACVSIITKVKVRLAAALLGIMFGTWVLIVHAPRVANHLHNRPEWTSLFICVAMCGGAWLATGSFDVPDSAERMREQAVDDNGGKLRLESPPRTAETR